jgi:pimeloyl-ACP methyl ester carboxylesterase
MARLEVNSVQCISPAGLHTMAYKEWGDPDNPNVLICVHGLTRVSDDFDVLATELSNQYRIICPDIVGRGRSDWLRDPQHYQVPQYVSDMVTLIARLNVESVHWFGTSLGGLIGMVLASLPGNPIRKLVLNDIGPVLDPVALARIAEYVGQSMQFATFEEGAEYIRQVSLSFGSHSAAQWRKLAADVLRQDTEGAWIRHYDLGLAVPFKTTTPETAKLSEQLLWAAYDAIRCPTLLIRGKDSDLLSWDTAHAMTKRGPKATLVEIPAVGHAPTFVTESQIDIAKKFLLD